MAQTTSDSIYGSFEQVVKKNPAKTALICLGRKISFSELQQMTLRFAASLHGLGVGPEDRVIIYLHNLPQTVVAWLALRRLNAVPINLAPIYPAYDIRYLANDSGARTIISMDTNVNYVAEVLPETPLKHVIVTNMFDLVPLWKKAIGRGFDKIPRGKVPKDDRYFSFKALLKNGRPTGLPPFQPREGRHTAVILYTGGTTGFPKGVPLPEGLFMYRVQEWKKAKQGAIPPGEDVTMLSAPLFHIIGQSDMAANLLIGGETLIVMPKVHLDAMFDHIQTYRVKSMFGVPALYRMILEHDRVDQYDLGSLRYCGVGGDVLPHEVARRWFEKYNIPLYQAYGSTETAGIISISYSQDGIPPEGAVGRINPGTEFKLVEPGTLEPVPAGRPGELIVTSPFAVQAYINKPGETGECFIQLEGKTWYRTKDIVRVDEQNWLHFEDRSGDMIKHKGYRIASAEIERVLAEHHAVIAASVVGIPDPAVGERIKAFVVLKEDVKGISAYDLQRWCRDRLPSYKVPAYIEYRDMLPKSKVGKFLRRELREEEKRKTAQT